MSLAKQIAGKIGETFAVQYLQQNKFRILERNFRTRNGEIDIIAIDMSEKPPVVCFIEVKTRRSVDFGTPIEAIGYYKLQAIIRTSEFYKLTHKNLPEAMRIDAVSIIINPDDTVNTIELVKNIS